MNAKIGIAAGVIAAGIGAGVTFLPAQPITITPDEKIIFRTSPSLEMLGQKSKINSSQLLLVISEKNASEIKEEFFREKDGSVFWIVTTKNGARASVRINDKEKFGGFINAEALLKKEKSNEINR